MKVEPVAETKSKYSKKIIAMIVLLCAVAGGAVWYFMYFTKTPEYSLNLIRESVVKHDAETFKKHVDLDSILSRGYEDMIALTIESDQTMTDFQRKMVSGFAQLLKGTIVTSFKEGIIRYVETGEWEIKEQNAQQGQPKVNPDKIADKTGIKNSAFKGIAYTKKEGSVATIGIRIFDEAAKKEMILDVKMRELNDGTWQIAELSNFKEYLSELDKVKAK